MNLVDIGANLAHDSFAADMATVLEDAYAAGVQRIVVTGSSDSSSRAAWQLCERFPDRLFSTAGVHPHHAADYSSSSEETIREAMTKSCVKAVGECGLDYFRDFSPRADQQSAFESQLALACELGKPVFLHQRDAIDDFVDIIKPWRDKFTQGVAHCFTDDERALRRLLDLDLHIGITGWICDERRGSHLADLVRFIPNNRLMIETDAPYLLPRSLRPRPKTRRNEPKWLPEVLNTIATATGELPGALAERTTRNAELFFDLPDCEVTA